MNEFEAALAKFPAKSIETILNQLLILRKRANSGEQVQLPCTIFHLRSGRDVRGWLLDVRAEHNEQYVLIHASECTRPPQYNVSYAALRDVEAVTICDAEAAAVTLSFGAVTIPPGASIPTRMAIRRRAQDIAAALANHALTLTVDLDDSTDEATRLTVSMALESVGSILTEIDAGNIGREALASVQSITLRAGAGFAVVRQGAVMTVDVPTDTSKAISRQMLYDEIARVL